MKVAEYIQHDGVGLAELVRKREVQASELMETAIELTDRINPQINFLSVDCRDLGREIAKGQLPESRLSGVPYLLKDLSRDWAGTGMTNGSKLFKNYVSPGDCETVRRAKAAGLPLFGKTAAPEFAFALSTESLLNGDTLNPWDTTRTPGGSSGGAAAAVAAGVVPVANASDGGGSTRVPAAYSGLVGLRPSRGRISWGPDFIELCSGMCTEGSVSRTVRDQAAYLDIMHGQLPGDRDTPPPPATTFEDALSRPLGKLRIGYTTRSTSSVDTYAAGVAAVHSAVEFCRSLGHEVKEMDFRGYDLKKAWGHVLGVFAIEAHLPSYLAAKALKGSEPSGTDLTRFMFESARWAAGRTGADHAADVEGIRQAARQVQAACQPYDLVLMPMTVAAPPKIGFNHMDRTEFWEYNETIRENGMPFSVMFNISGQPACSVPIALDELGLPVALQIVGAYGDDERVLALAAEFERGMPWKDRHPTIWAGAYA